MELIDGYQSRLKLERVLEYLETREVENGIAWRTVTSALSPDSPESGRPDLGAPLIQAVEDGGTLVASGIWTPPFPLLVAGENEKALRMLAEFFARLAKPPGRVLGGAGTSAAFSEVWQEISGLSSHFARGMIIYEATAVVVPDVDGGPDYARLDDLETLYEWSQRSAEEVGLGEHGLSRELIRAGIENGTVRVWRNQRQQPVSTAADVGRTRNGGRVSGVYTPPEERCNGYASACTATLTRNILESGCRFAFLYADAVNPQANKVYQRIGYRHVCDVTLYDIAAPRS